MPTITELGFQVDARPFAAACATAARRVPTKPEPPTLGGILLEVLDGRLTVSAFDFDVSTSSTLEVTGASDGRCLVSGRLLAELAKTLPAKPVTAALGATALALTCGTVRLSLPTMTVEDYPALPTLPEPIGTVDAQTFAGAIERVAPAAAAIGTPPAALTGVHLAFGPDGIRVMATDRYRCAVLTIGWTPGGPNVDAAALVPAAMLLDLARLVDAIEPITITHGTGTIGFSLPHATIIGRLLVAKEFPVGLPKQLPARSDTPLVVASAPLAVAVKRAAMVLESASPVVLEFAPDEVTVGGDGDGAADETLPCNAETEVDVKFRPQYLLDALNMCGGKEVEFTLGGRRKPAILSVPGDPSYRHSIMPVA